MALEQIRFDLPRIKASSRERSSKSSRTVGAFSRVENSRLSRRREEKKRRRKVCDIIRAPDERRRTKLHEIAVQPVHFVRSEKDARERDRRSTSKSQFSSAVLPSSARMDGARFPERERDGFLPTTTAAASRRGALKNAGPRGRLPPGEVHSSSMSLFPLSGAGGTQYAAFLQKCRGFANVRKLYYAKRKRTFFSDTKNTR